MADMSDNNDNNTINVSAKTFNALWDDMQRPAKPNAALKALSVKPSVFEQNDPAVIQTGHLFEIRNRKV